MFFLNLSRQNNSSHADPNQSLLLSFFINCRCHSVPNEQKRVDSKSKICIKSSKLLIYLINKCISIYLLYNQDNYLVSVVGTFFIGQQITFSSYVATWLCFFLSWSRYPSCTWSPSSVARFENLAASVGFVQLWTVRSVGFPGQLNRRAEVWLLSQFRHLSMIFWSILALQPLKNLLYPDLSQANVDLVVLGRFSQSR